MPHLSGPNDHGTALVDFKLFSILHGRIIHRGNPPQWNGDYALIGQFHVDVFLIEFTSWIYASFGNVYSSMECWTLYRFTWIFSSICFTLVTMPFLQQVFQILFNRLWRLVQFVSSGGFCQHASLLPSARARLCVVVIILWAFPHMDAGAIFVHCIVTMEPEYQVVGFEDFGTHHRR